MKPNIICDTECYHDIRIFTWRDKHGTAEFSNLNISFSEIFCHVYNDAMDYGFGVSGVNRDIIFAIDHKEHDSEGELTGWVLKSISEPGFTITLFND